jgi:hypothetical protein
VKAKPDRAAPATPADTPPVERQVVSDMVRRGLPALPVLVVVAAVFWGVAGALSAAFAIGLVLVNFFLAATLLAAAARVSMALLALAAVGGFILRLALITVAVLAVKDLWWVELVPLGFTLVITHLGLLVWEARHISASLAFPGLKPEKG